MRSATSSAARFARSAEFSALVARVHVARVRTRVVRVLVVRVLVVTLAVAVVAVSSFAVPAAADAPLDAAHAAVHGALRAENAEATCRDTPLARIAANAEIRSLGRAGADAVVLASVREPCVCGVQNCPYIALRLSAPPRVLFSTTGSSVRIEARAGSVPDVLVGDHDSVAVMDDTRYVFRDGTYVVGARERVRVTDGARKTDVVPIRFAAGASSAELRGRVSAGWYDAYTFAAARGQRVTISAVRSTSPLTVTLFGPKDGDVTQLRPGVAVTLPRAATYLLHVENAADADAPYALTLAIR